MLYLKEVKKQMILNNIYLEFRKQRIGLYLGYGLIK